MENKNEFKLRFNTEYKKTPNLCWRAVINNIEHLVSDIQIDGVQVMTTSHIIETGETKWSIACKSSHYKIDDNKKLFIYN